MKTKKFKVVKKVVSAIALSAVVATFATTAVGAVTINRLENTSSKFTSDEYFSPVSYFYGVFEAKNSSHGPRGGTLYNTGSLKGTAYLKLTYLDASKGLRTSSETGKCAIGSGWVQSDWVEAPSDCQYVQQITFTGDKYNDNGTLIIRDYVSVTKSF